jgi:hypothetical protein
MKKDMAGRASRTKSALDALDPYQRVQMEGFRPGTYLRLRFKGMRIPPVGRYALENKLLQLRAYGIRMWDCHAR